MEDARLQRLKARHRLLRALRGFFDQAGFTEVETPAIVTSPGLDVHLDAFAVTVRRERKFLHTSPEYAMKRLLSEGLGSIYQMGKVFRRDECGHIHNPEFTLLEWYGVGLSMDGLVAQTEALVAHAARCLSGGTRVHSGQGNYTVDLTPPWPRLSVREAFQRYAEIGMDEVLPDEERFFELLVDRIEPQLPKDRPTVLHSYPASMASLACLDPDDPSVARRFEVYVDGVELCNGFEELTDAGEQRARFQRDLRERTALGKDPYPVDERFLNALERGLPPCAGNAVGVDRLAMVLLGAPDIASVMAFVTDDA